MDIRTITTAGYNFWSAGAVISGTETILIGYIWNGTGVLDTGGDWVHSGHGTENAVSMRSGTNGLDASGMSNGDKINFSSADANNIAAYDALVVWINVGSWESNKDVKLELKEFGGDYGTTLYLSSYIDIESVGVWQKAVVLLEAFNLSGTEVDKLRLTSTGDVGIYLDDVSFGIGTVVNVPTPIEKYDVSGDEFGKISMSGEESGLPGIPSPRAELLDLDPDIATTDDTNLIPDVNISELKPGLKATPTP